MPVAQRCSDRTRRGSVGGRTSCGNKIALAILFAIASVNHMLPSAPAAMAPRVFPPRRAEYGTCRVSSPY
jgi:hypothetical protein